MQVSCGLCHLSLTFALVSNSLWPLSAHTWWLGTSFPWAESLDLHTWACESMYLLTCACSRTYKCSGNAHLQMAPSLYISEVQLACRVDVKLKPISLCGINHTANCENSTFIFISFYHIFPSILFMYLHVPLKIKGYHMIPVAWHH